MHTRGRAGIGVALTLFSIAATLSFGIIVTNAQTSGRRAATQADLEWLKWAGFENPTVGMTIDPSNPYIGQAPSEAKMWLAQHTKLNKSRIVCLNPQFAQKLKSFMEDVPGGPPEITSAYRTLREQEAAMRSGASRVSNACSGYHLYGLAADFNNNNSQQTNWMRANAPRYGIKPIGNWDPNHFQDASGRSGQCGACNAEGLGDTSSGGYSAPSSGSPSAGFTESLRQWLVPQQQTQATPSQPAVPSQPISQSQNPLDAFNEDEISGVSSQITTETTPPASSTAADRLEELAFGPKPATTTATSVPLVVSGSDAAMLSGSPQQAATQSVTPSIGAISPSQSTFTSPDLSWGGGAVQQPVTGWQATLVAIRGTLTRILALLTPFGGFAEDGE
jgi:hypothetical protein